MSIYQEPKEHHKSGILSFFNLDTTLALLLMSLCGFGLLALYSASRQNIDLVFGQALKLGLGCFVMLAIAHLPPKFLKYLAPPLFIIGMLCCLLIFAKIGDKYLLSVAVKGSRRWLDLGFFRFQPSEIMKLAVPMMLAYFLDKRILPPSFFTILVALLICLIPFVTILKQPDLGTSLLVIFPALCVIFLAGLGMRYILTAVLAIATGAPLFWEYIMTDYQKQRVFTFLDPESSPLKSGYQVIQSKIAIGSGGMYGKGWLNSTQVNLQFLPEATTDFIYAVIAEEFGLVGLSVLLGVYLLIILRCFMISIQARDTFFKLLGASITISLFANIFINGAMVSGILPVVGLPLPLISRGGTSIIALFASFGILMNIYSHRLIKPKKKKFSDYD